MNDSEAPLLPSRAASPPPPPRRPPAHRTHALVALAAVAATLAAVGPGGGAAAWARATETARAGAAYRAVLDGAGALLPPVIHAALPALPPRGGRLVVVGDVHGRVDALRALLRKVEFAREGGDTLILTGDVVGKGDPAAYGPTLDLAIQLDALAVRGNHDDEVLAALEAGDGAALNLTAAHRRWLAALPFSLALPGLGAAVVHAGAVPGVALGRQSLADVYLMKGVLPVRPLPRVLPVRGAAARARYAAAYADGRAVLPWAPLWRGRLHLVFGHDSQRGLQLEARATGLDTGCVAGGRLTALVVEPARRKEVDAWPGGEVVQVECGGR